jgi:simple sugar transport system permease protein
VTAEAPAIGGLSLPTLPPWAATLARWVGAFAGAMALFSLLLLAKGSNPLTVYSNMWSSTFTNSDSLQQILIKATPLALAALAVVVPARAGLVNVGGEGQVVLGAIAAAGVGLALDRQVQGKVVLVLMILAAAAAGAGWAAIAAFMRLKLRVNEAVTTLLLNYVALDLLLYLIYAPWKDKHGSGQPATRPLTEPTRLPLISGTKVHVGIVIAVVAAVVVWAVLRYTTWGFRLSAVGGNPEAARRAGLPVARLLLSAMLVGGALAGLAGMVHFAGVEFKLRTGLTENFGYIGFLASWLARHKPLPVVAAALLLAAITVSGDSLQLDSGLPAATVNVLTGLVLFAVLGWTTRKKARA